MQNTNTNGSQNTNENTNCRFLNAVSYRLSATELRIGRTEELQGHPKLASDALSAVEVSTSPSQKTDEDSDAGDDAVIPSAKFLKKSKHIQEAVDLRLQELVRINEQGEYQSQREGNELVNIKYQVPWPKKYALSGTSKSKVTYDSLFNVSFHY